MTVTATIRTFFAVCLASSVLASSALAAGEPKNELPFTHAIGVESATTLVFGVKHATALSVHASTGEAKNSLPFTRR